MYNTLSFLPNICYNITLFAYIFINFHFSWFIYTIYNTILLYYNTYCICCFNITYKGIIIGSYAC